MQYFYTGTTATYVIYNGVLANKWYNLTNTVSSSGHSFYMNGVLMGTDTTTVSNVTGQNITGITFGSGKQYNQFVGYVQDLRFYKTVLSARQVLGIYQSQGIPPRLTMTQTSRSGTSTTMNSG
jgi:hypothetical protein